VRRRRRLHIGCHTVRVQEAFAYVLFGVVGLGILLALGTLLLRRGTYDEIGAGGFFKEEGAARPRPASVEAAERDEEIRQLLRARNARHETSGGEIVDVEAELARLTAPAIDPVLEAEIRDFVIRRNERRVARGKPPLDVEAEVARRIAEFG